MGTNLVQLRTKEEFLADFKPLYAPLFPSLLAGNAQQYPATVGKVNFKRLDTVGDIRAKNITPKDTEIQQIAAGEVQKSFKKYLKGNQFQVSAYQERQGVEDVLKQVIDENNKLADEILLFGEGTSGSDVLNNGLFYSADSNYYLPNSVQVDKDSNDEHLIDMHAKIMANVAQADVISGRKLILIYGSTATAKYDSLFGLTNQPFKTTLRGVLESNYTVQKMPPGLSFSGNGWLIINMDNIKTHYTAVPSLEDQGVNAEKKYAWFNFVLGSMMVEVLQSRAIINQAVTFEA